MKTGDLFTSSSPFRADGYRTAALIAWTIVAVLTAIWECSDNAEFKASNALAMARMGIEKDIVFRRWAAEHGGVYVPVTGKTPPNPWLTVPERDITTPSGRRLTLMNPAYMIRQVFEVGQSSIFAPGGHITSLNPIRPENAPDPWEARALAAFESGTGEVGEFLALDGKPVYRYMRPLRTERPCLKCHGAQGYREGMVRGGISIAIPTAELEQGALRSNIRHLAIIAEIWLAGLWGILFAFSRIRAGAAALTAERDNLRSVFGATPMPMLLFDDRMEAALVNSAFRDYCADFDVLPDKRCGTILGCATSLSDPLGCGNLPACDSCRLMRALREVARSGQPTRGEAAVRRAGTDGAVKEAWLLYGVETVMLDGRKYLLMSFADITERMRYEKALLEHAKLERRLSGTAANIPGFTCSFRMGPDGTSSFPYASAGIWDLFGLRPEDVGDDAAPFWARFHPADRQRVLDAVAESARTMSQMHVEARVFHPEKGELWIEVRSTPESASGGHIVWYGVILEITRRKRAEEVLRQREQEFRALAEHSPDAIARYDRQCRHLYVNPALEHLAGKPADLLIGEAPSECLACNPEAAGRIAASVTQVLEHGIPADAELSWQATDCTTHHFLLRAVPEFDAAGRVASVLCISRDITSLRKTEAHLRHAQKMNTVGTLAGGVAHDFNNLLTVISGYSELLRLSLAGDERNFAYLREISEAASRGAELTRGLLAFSGKRETVKQFCDLNQIVADLQRIISRLLRADITINFDICKGRLPVFVDRVQIEQVLINLLINARDALVSGGRIDVATSVVDECGEETVADIAAPAKAGYGLVTVADNGMGMDEETASRIFEPFFTTKGAGKGTGLGLAIAFGIVGHHSGRISVASTPGKGSLFRVYLPVYPEAVQPELSPEPEIPDQCGDELVLVVDDEPNVLKLMRELLTRQGYTVLTAADGVEALELFAMYRDEIRAVAIDMIMPRMNGRETIERIRQQDASLPIILMSGYTDDVIKRSDLEALDVVVLQKPVPPRKLAVAIRAALG